FGKDIIPAYLNDEKKLYAYRFRGYWKDVGTIDSLWEANMDLLDDSSRLNLMEDDWKIYTESENILPQYIGPDAVIENCSITEGCAVYGKAVNSVIGANAVIGEGAEVIDCVVNPGAIIGEGAKLTRCVVEDEIKVPAGAVYGSADSEHILLVAGGQKAV
ncbi:MAG: glucose-1-phosphate adenylyltransferase, partial [Solobacterium sp.]|nr:glucose-1-phosphate adenylyltransferase [Solobacterium sp.]